MRLTGRVQRLERRLKLPDELDWPFVAVAGPTEADKPVVVEIVRARLERSWPRGLVQTYVTGDDVAAWREGRTEDAIAGVNHRVGGVVAGNAD